MIQDQLERFIEAQKISYDEAYQEIVDGKKKTHWMWYIFPQLRGLGYSQMANYYAIASLDEAIAYLKDPVLGQRLINICKEMHKHCDKSATDILGSPDDKKLRSCLTLFALVPGADPIFLGLLDTFYNGEQCKRTIQMLNTEV